MKHYLWIALLAVVACQPATTGEIPQPENESNHLYCANGFCIEGELVDEGKIYLKNDRAWLWAGEDSSWHFDITHWDLTTDGFIDYGYNRETFAALLEPKYLAANSEPGAYRMDEPVIILHDEGQTKVYPFILMRFHEIINEEVDGTPVMIAYCYLAELAAVYNRTYCDKALTFAVSGYTNAEENIWDDKQGFVLWDRETSSLWWPQIGRAVSGTMQGTAMTKATSSMWEISTWESVINDMPDAVVLAPSHPWNPPKDWPVLQCEDLDCCEK